jgi:hypothetical protein
MLTALLLGFAVTGCSLWAPSRRIVTVIDAEDGTPITDARIAMSVSVGFGGVDQLEMRSDAAGTATFDLKALAEEAGSVWGVRNIRVTKHGYHFNGIAHAPERKHYRIGLRRVVAPMTPIVVGNDRTTGEFVCCGNREYFEGDAIDLFSLAGSERRYYWMLKPVADGAEYDFRFVSVTNSEKARNRIGRGSAIMEFVGKGGARRVGDAKTGPVFAFENLIEAPTDGYQNRVPIETGQAYVARTRDGAHYFKFTTKVGKKLGGQDFVSLQVLLQPDGSTNLESPARIPNVAILEVDRTTVEVTPPSEYSPPIPSRVVVDNVGTFKSSLSFKVIPVSPNVRLLSQPLRKLPIEDDTIVVYPATGSVRASSSARSLQIYGNANGSFRIETNGGSATIEVVTLGEKGNNPI